MKSSKWNLSEQFHLGDTATASRRQFLRHGLAFSMGALVLPCVDAGSLAAMAGTAATCAPIVQFSTDVTPLLQKSLGSYAQKIAQEMEAALADVLSPNQTLPDTAATGKKARPSIAKGRRLIVRLDDITMVSDAGNGSYRSRGGGGAGNNDELEGVGFLYEGASKTPKQYPILAVLGADSGGAWYDPKSEGRRLTALCHHFAWWLNHAILADSCGQG